MNLENLVIEVAPSIKSDHKVNELVEKSSDILESVVRRTHVETKAAWDIESYNGNNLRITLRLSDYTGSVSASFTEAQLHDPSELRSRLRRLWAALLRIRSHVQLETLLNI